jgi:hypothetical protein
MTRGEAVAVWSAIVLCALLNAYVALGSERQAAQPLASEPSHDQIGDTSEPVAVPTPSDAACRHRLDECRALMDRCVEALSDCRQELATTQLPHQRFEKAQPSAESEARFRPYVEAALAPFEGLETELECRADVCRLELKGKDLDGFGSPAFMLQSHRSRRGLIEAYAVGSAPPVGDEAERKIFHFDLYEPGMESGADALDALIETFLRTDALRECHDRYPAEGDLRVQLRLIAGVGINVAMGGDLGLHPAGLCVGERLRGLAERATLPDRVTPATVYKTWHLPPE